MVISSLGRMSWKAVTVLERVVALKWVSALEGGKGVSLVGEAMEKRDIKRTWACKRGLFSEVAIISRVHFEATHWSR